MEAYQLNKLVSKPELATQDDLPELDLLEKEFPYFQVVKVLKARITQNERDIRKAAAYVADRTVLENIVGVGYEQESPPQIISPEQQQFNAFDAFSSPEKSINDEPSHSPNLASSTMEQAPQASTETPTINQSAYLEQQELPKTLDDSEIANILSAPMESGDSAALVATGQGDADEPQAQITTFVDEPIVEIPYPDEQEKQFPDFEEVNYSIPEFDDVSFFHEQQTTQSEQAPPTASEKPIFALDELLDKTAQSGEQTISDRIERQRKIIENFISGSVQPPSQEEIEKASSIEQEDLSAKSSTISAEIVSEGLARFFLKQGKKDKAIEIYRLLMEKHPEKIAYFAAEIAKINNI